jgi:uncharacterized protein YjiS (DUF1127 family)
MLRGLNITISQNIDSNEVIMDNILTSHSALGIRPTQLLGRLLALMALRRSRRGLEHLDDYLLRDIGLTRAEALRESARPVWNAPDHWRLQDRRPL